MRPPFAQAKLDIASLERRVPSSNAARDVLAERLRQTEAEGWTPEHDDGHTDFQLGKAAAAYLGEAIIKDKTRAEHATRTYAPSIWPWPALSWWKPKDRRRDLVRAGALIIAEIERLDRAAARAKS